MPDLMFNSVKRITDASPEDREMMREAIRGEFEAGKYLRDMGTSAAAGAAGGAIAGGGVGSLPGAAVGAIGGAVFGLGSNAVSDIAYQMYGDEGKAAWQAGDIEDHLNKMGGWINGKTQDPTIGQFLSSLGASYKNYIDVSVNKAKSEDHLKGFKENIFNPQSSSYAAFQQALAQQQPQRPVQSQSSRFVRIAYEDSPAGLIGGTGATLAGDQIIKSIGTTPPPTPVVAKTPIGDLISKYWAGALSSEETISFKQLMQDPAIRQQIQQVSNDPELLHNVQSQAIAKWGQSGQAGQIVDDLAQGVGKNLLKPSNLLSTAWKGVKGLGVGLAVDLASNWALDKIDMMMTGGEIQMFRRELQEVGKVITEINRLTNNREDVVYAGNILWTNLKEIDRMLEVVENNKAQQPNTPQSTQVNQPTEHRQNTASAKFKRLK